MISGLPTLLGGLSHKPHCWLPQVKEARLARIADCGSESATLSPSPPRVGHVTKIIDQQKYIEVWVHMPPEIRHYIAHKGSITVDGVSLTVNEITEDEFMLWLIPHTLEKTVISTYKVGTRVNLEVDVIAR